MSREIEGVWLRLQGLIQLPKMFCVHPIIRGQYHFNDDNSHANLHVTGEGGEEVVVGVIENLVCPRDVHVFEGTLVIVSNSQLMFGADEEGVVESWMGDIVTQTGNQTRENDVVLQLATVLAATGRYEVVESMGYICTM